MNELLGLAAALASLVALACWARTVPTRAWGDDTPTGAARWRAKAVALTGHAFFGKLVALSLAAICYGLVNFGLLL